MNQAITSIIRHEAKNPVIWFAFAAATFAWPLSLHYSPLATTLGSANARDLAYDVAFLLATAGALYSDGRMAPETWMLGRASRARGSSLWLLLVVLGSLIPSLFSLLPLALSQGYASLPGIATMALVSAHLAALSFFLRSLGFSYSERSVALIFLALALPAALSGDEGTLSPLFRALDPVAGGELGSANLPLTVNHIGSIVGLILCAHTLKPGCWR